MQFLKITPSTTLSDLADIVGERNVGSILALNDLERRPNIGEVFARKCRGVIASGKPVDWQRKSSLLNKLTEHSDVFEEVSLLSESGWMLYSATGNLPGMLKVPETIVLPDSTDVIGDSMGVGVNIYKQVQQSIQLGNHEVDPSIFNKYVNGRPSSISSYLGHRTSDPFQWFHIPWGKVSLYSSLSGDSKDFPVFPEEMTDQRKANYTQMPDVLYQYEPWQVYQSSGPRTNTYTFLFHRDMWSGDHNDGKANELIRFCEANCYPEYSGSAVNTSTVTLYVSGSPLITGVLTDVNVQWSGPLGHDDYYLVCELSLTITEVSVEPLNYSRVANMGLIG